MSKVRLSMSSIWGSARDSQGSLNLEAFGTVTYQSLILERSHLQTNNASQRENLLFIVIQWIHGFLGTECFLNSDGGLSPNEATCVCCPQDDGRPRGAWRQREPGPTRGPWPAQGSALLPPTRCESPLALGFSVPAAESSVFLGS